MMRLLTLLQPYGSQGLSPTGYECDSTHMSPGRVGTASMCTTRASLPRRCCPSTSSTTTWPASCGSLTCVSAPPSGFRGGATGCQHSDPACGEGQSHQVLIPDPQAGVGVLFPRENSPHGTEPEVPGKSSRSLSQPRPHLCGDMGSLRPRLPSSCRQGL